jgi:hypothetical protein
MALYAFALAGLNGCNFGTAPGGTEGEGLTGILVDNRGAPVAHVHVRIYPDSTAPLAKRAASTPRPDSVETNGAGRFDFQHLVPGARYNLEASLTRGDTILSLFIQDLVYHGGREDIGSKSLVPTGGARLQVLLNGSAAAGTLSCSVAGSPYAGAVDDSGYCVVKGLPPGVFQVTVSGTGFRTAVSDAVTVVPGVVTSAGSVELIPTDTPPPPSVQHFQVTSTTVALWTFNAYDAGGPPYTFADLGARGATLRGDERIALTPSPHGAALEIENSSPPVQRYFIARGDTSFDPNKTGWLTVEARVFLTSYPSNSNQGGVAQVAGIANGVKLLIGSDGSLQAAGLNKTGPESAFLSFPRSSAGTVPLGRWVNLAVTVDANASQLYAYVDGQPVQLTMPSGFSILAGGAWSNNSFCVGSSNFYTQPFTGRIDEVRVSNAAVLGFGPAMTRAPEVPVQPDSIMIVASQDAVMWATTTGTAIGSSVQNAGANRGLSTGIYDLNTATRSLVQFTLPAGIKSAGIRSAKFRINPYEWAIKNSIPTPYRVHLYRVLRPWKEGKAVTAATATAAIDGVNAYERFWGTQNGAEDWNKVFVGLDDVDAASVESASASIEFGSFGALEFDITALAKSWADDPAQNFGFILVADVPASNELVTHYPSYNSKDADVADNLKPRLILDADLTSPEPAKPMISVVAIADGNVAGPVTGYPDNNGLLNKNGGIAATLSSGSYDVYGGGRALVRFDIPPGYTATNITKAVMRLTVSEWVIRNVHTAVRLDVHRLLKSWKEGTSAGGTEAGASNSALVDGITGLERFWGAQDGTEDWSQPLVGLNDVDAASQVSASLSKLPGTTGTWEFDVTALAKAWAGDPASNFGVVLATDMPADNDAVADYPMFHSKDAAVPVGSKPTLILNGN